MDYKQRNEGDFESAKAWYKIVKEQNNQLAIKILEGLFPSLKESDDEMVRKEITAFFKNFAEHGTWKSIPDVTKWIAWLEKHGKNNMGISEATKQKLEDNLNKALEKETPKSLNEFLEKQGEQKLPIEKLPSEMKTIGESLGFTTQEDCDRYNQMVTDLIMSDDDKGDGFAQMN